MPPWEKYQSQAAPAPAPAASPAGPWAKYQQPSQPAATQPPSVAEDTAKSLAGGVERGIAGTAMILPNLINQVVAGPQLLGRGIAETVDKAIGVEPQPRGELWQPFHSSEDVLQAMPEPVRPHTPQTAAGQAADLVGQMAGGVIATKGIQKAEPLLKDQSGAPAAKPPRMTADEIRTQAKAKYQEAAQKGGALPAQSTDDFIAKAEQTLPQTQAGKLVLGETPATKMIDRIQGLRGKPLTLDEAQEIDQGLGDAISGHVDTRTGKLTADGKKLQDIQTALRDTIENAQLPAGGGFDALKDARGLWSQSARLRDIENIISRAEQMDNPATGIKTGFRNLYNNASRMRGFTDEEKALIKNAAESGYVTDLLRMFGSRLIPIGELVSGGGLTGTAAAEAASLASRSAAGKMQVGRAEKVAEAIANRNQPAAPPPAPINPTVPTVAATGSALSEAQARLKKQPQPAPQPPSAISPQGSLIDSLSPISDANAAETQPTNLIDRMAQAESGGDPAARNPNSSASGLLQFTNGTWAAMVAKYGKQTGITLKDKENPDAQRVMGDLLARDNAKILAKQTGAVPTDGDIYLAHVFGPIEAARLIKAQGSGREAITLFPRRVTAANKSIFWDGKRPRSVEEVYQLMSSKVS